MFSLKALAPLLAAGVICAMAETHTVILINKCGFGTPMFVQDGRIISRGASFVFNGPLPSSLAYLQTGNCGTNGEGCTIVETTLRNPTTPGRGSSTDISLIPPHNFSVATGWRYINGCEGVGQDCTNANCVAACHSAEDSCPQLACQSDNVGLNITFCD